jgi:mRNA interferase RelE/StbE
MAGRSQQGDYARGNDRADLLTNRSICFAHVDPCGAGQFRQARRADAHGAVGGAGGGKHRVERLERHVAIDRLNAIERHLRHEPDRVSRSRIKRLRGFNAATYRLRVGDFRIFYDVAEVEVVVIALPHKRSTATFYQEEAK